LKKNLHREEANNQLIISQNPLNKENLSLILKFPFYHITNQIRLFLFSRLSHIENAIQNFELSVCKLLI